MDSGSGTDRVTRIMGGDSPWAVVRSFHLVVEAGPQAGATWASTGNRCAIGSHPSNDLAVDDETVSGFHCEITVGSEGARIRDSGSRNGTIVDGVRVVEAWLRSDSRIRLGTTVVRFQFGTDVNPLPISDSRRFGGLVGSSLGMRTAFGMLERAAASTATVLIEGETGTGKEGAARGVHEASARAKRPFVIVDCGAIPANLLESELFGHERGSFTGAQVQRIGAFEEADGGTIFLDELGELPIDLQPKLLRALEQREVRRIGANNHRPVDVRVIAATNRDLRAEVNAGRFRSDVYYRLAVVRVTLPPLRERPEDIPGLAEAILTTLTDDLELRAPLLEPAFLERLQRSAWPGNVRELRNYLERCLVMGGPVPMGPPREERPVSRDAAVDPNVPYAEARQGAIDAFERSYVEALMAHHDGKVAAAARAAGMNRAYLYRLLQKLGFR